VSYTTDSCFVNAKNALLTLSPNDVPTVSLSGGTTFNLPNHPWSRWYLKTHFKHLNADEKGAIWYQHHDPMKFDPIPFLASLPRPYQILAINRMKMSNCALWLDMGLGKTYISIAFALWMFQQKLGNVSLVLCPPSVFVTWKDSVKALIQVNAQARVELIHGARKSKVLANLRSAPLNTPTFLLTTYETLESVREQLQSMPISTIFFDESSKIKNFETNRTQSAHALVDALPNTKRFCLSGTPATKSPLGLYSQYEILGKGFSRQPTYQAFEKRYAITKTFMRVQLPHGRITSIPDEAEMIDDWLREHCPPMSNVSYHALGFTFSAKPTTPKQIKILNWYNRDVQFINLEELHAITQMHAYSLWKSDVLTDLPPKTRVRRSVEMTAEQRKAYVDMTEYSRAEIANKPFSFHDSNSPHAKLHQIANGFIINNDKTVTYFKQQPKLLELAQIIEEAGDQKIVIWSPMRPQIAQVSEFLRQELSKKCLELHGGVAPKDREAIIHGFRDTDANFLVANPTVGGLGLNLQFSWLQIFMSNWYSPDVRGQAEDRQHRIGQENPVCCVDVLTRGTLEAAILRTVLGEIKLEKTLISMTTVFGKEEE
jgi:SNF2 family DNA or RNA helicase